jgi:alpha-mannosidase
MKKALAILLIGVMATSSLVAQTAAPAAQPKRTLGVVATAHLDTQWRWTIRNTINEYIPATLHQNFRLFEKYPDYVFSFEGAFRYMLMKEYYPADYERMRKYISTGQWRVTGSWVDAVDVNMPSFESLVRQTLYGNGYYKTEFNRSSRDVFLPDCFGFGYALPSIETYCGLKSFSTQKLSWGSAYGVPFDIGRWQGVDGSWVYAALRPGSYGATIRTDLSRDTLWGPRVEEQGKKSGLYAAYSYFGTGDTGGSPDSESVDWLSKSMKSDGPVKVKSIGADDLVDIASTVAPEKLPGYNGELVMTRHGVGCYTSQAAMKRWNRQNEQLGDAAERAAVIATQLGGLTYPREALRDTWVRFLWHQFHDDLTGTSIPEAYEFSWNDEILCQNRFAQILENAVEATTPSLDTRTKGMPIVLFNPVAMTRQDIVEVKMPVKDGVAKGVRVVGPDGKDVPAQIGAVSHDSADVQFLATVPSVGYAVYDLRPAGSNSKSASLLTISNRAMENSRYKVALNDNGDVSSIFDKVVNKELLTSPIQYQLLFNKPKAWPAWEIWYEDIMAKPQAYLGGPAEIKIVENGPARVAWEITRKTEKSVFKTTIRLAANSDRIEYVNDIDWYERETLLKVAFPLACTNDSVTYDLGLGTIKRGLNRKDLYEVVGQQWADMTSEDNSFGVSVLNDCKYGWDHPDKGTLRLSLIHTPGVYESWMWVGDQKSMDNGHHTFTFAVQGHAGSWQDAGTVAQAARLNQPIYAFNVPSHKGVLGKQYSFLNIAGANAPFVNSIKMAENSGQISVRVRETSGRLTNGIRISLTKPVATAEQINGVEDKVGDVSHGDGALTFSLTPYQPKSFGLSLKPEVKPEQMRMASQFLALPFNGDGISTDDSKTDGNIDGLGSSLAGEQLPDTLNWCGVPFVFGPKAVGANNIVLCTGQTASFAPGVFKRLYILATAVGGPAKGTFKMGDASRVVWVQDYAEPIAQWNNRMTNGIILEDPDQISPAYINRQPVAWYASHRHNAAGENEAYKFTYLYLLQFDIPSTATSVTLPANERIKLFAATVVNEPYDDVSPAHPLYDVANGTVARIEAERTAFLEPLEVKLSCPNPGAVIRYTTDGTAPTANSAIYSKPIELTTTSTVKARAFLDGANDTHVASMSFQKLSPHASIVVKKTAPGLEANYYEGTWDKLPNFDTVKVVKPFMADKVVLPPFSRQEDFGLTFAGLISIPSEGLYEFALSSDDGSRLWIGDSVVVDNDGLHGSGDVVGYIALKPGLHRIRVIMFQAKGDRDLGLSVKGPGIAKQPVGGWMVSHEVTGKVVKGKAKTKVTAPVKGKGRK